MGDRRRETGYVRQETGDKRWKTLDGRQTGDGRQETEDRRRKKLDGRRGEETGEGSNFSEVISEKCSSFNLAGELTNFKEH